MCAHEHMCVSEYKCVGLTPSICMWVLRLNLSMSGLYSKHFISRGLHGLHMHACIIFVVCKVSLILYFNLYVLIV